MSRRSVLPSRPGRRLAALWSLLLPLVLLLSPLASAHAQESEADPAPSMTAPAQPSPADVRMQAVERRTALAEQSLVASVPFENIGPTVMSGRVVDLAVNPADPTIFYVAYASGGLWKTTNNGRSFTPLFDHEASMTIGDIAVDWDDGERIWVGTGENNSSRSSYAGTGVYVSDDQGASWRHVGLAETQRTGRIRIHPDDPNTVWVGAVGPLYSASSARGLYKTTDGGESWTQTLSVDDRTGVIDLVVDATNPSVLYAATWERARTAWNFVEGGEGSGIYKSTDGGDTWQKLSGGSSGFPEGDTVGRIGLALHADTGTLYAFLDNQARRPETDEEETPDLTKDMLREMDRDAFLELGEDALDDYLARNDFPSSYTAESVLEMVREGDIEPIALVEYLEDANAQLFDTPVIGPEVYVSTDGGGSWERTHDDFIDDVYFSYGYYFGEIRVAPQDKDRIYIMGVPLLKSTDGGESFDLLMAGNLHVDHHALWVNPDRDGHLINGNDGGVNISYDDGETWWKANTPPVGQFYAVQVDNAEPYNVYGGLQDNGVWGGPNTYEFDYEWYAEGDYPYDRVLGGDGMQIAVDTRSNDVIYTGFQFGNYFRINRATGGFASVKPQHELGERPYRFNWQTPVHLSRHNQDILYLGSQYLHRSLDQGETWQKISPDLTAGARDGDVPYGTLTMIDESPLQFGLLYTGSDDGRIHVSKDGGSSWTRIDDGLPQNLWVSRVDASNHDASRVYASLNGYRSDHFVAYVYRSDDYGQTWTRLGDDLPAEPVNVVLEDPHNEDVVYVGTDHGLYVSLDRGDTFMAFRGDLPAAPVHDLKVQTREQDLVVGTHGRSIFRADVSHVQALTPDVRDEALHLFAVDSLQYEDDWGAEPSLWDEDEDGPSVTIPYYVQSAGETSIRVETEDGTRLQTLPHDAEAGLNYAVYDVTASERGARRYNRGVESEDDKLTAADDGKRYLRPGTYTLVVEHDGTRRETTLRVTPPPSQRSAEPRMENGVPSPSEEQETK